MSHKKPFGKQGVAIHILILNSLSIKDKLIEKRKLHNYGKPIDAQH